MQKTLVCKTAAIVSSIGAINWGVVAVFNTDIVSMIFGSMTLGTRIIYGLIAGMGFLVLIGSLSCSTACDAKH